MAFYKFVDRLERVIDTLFFAFRRFFPRRPAWFKLSMTCILAGASLLSSPWWVPLVFAFFGVTTDALGLQADGFSLWTSPEFYGGIALVLGIATSVFFGLIVGEPFKAAPFVGSAVIDNETFLSLAEAASQRSKLPLKYEHVDPEKLKIAIPQGSFDGLDYARALRSVAANSGVEFLEELYIVQNKNNIIIGKGK